MIDDDITLDGPTMGELRNAATTGPAVVVNWGAATSQGKTRERNEDAWGHHGSSVFVVADGMGGYEGGDVAAEVATRSLVAASVRARQVDWEEWFGAANIAVRAATAQRGFARSGAAVVGCSVVAGVVSVAHAGDARAYRLDGSDLHCLTSDHTVKQALANDRGRDVATGLSGGELGALTRYLGGSDAASTPSLVTAIPRPGDRLVLCTDGVSRQLSCDEIASLGMLEDPGHAARSLVERADLNGGVDNATAVCIDFGAAATSQRLREGVQGND